MSSIIKVRVRVRNDDVLVGSSSWPDPFKRFSQIHRWIIDASAHMIHVPAILTEEIQAFPQCIEYIKGEAKAGRMVPELHGFHHEIDYRTRSYKDCCEDLEKAIGWMVTNIGVTPTVWYTPRCADHPNMREAANKFNLQFVASFMNKLEGRYGVVQRLRDKAPIEFLDGIEISCHWWSSGLRLKRVIEAVKCGSWLEASKQNRELFND